MSKDIMWVEDGAGDRIVIQDNIDELIEGYPELELVASRFEDDVATDVAKVCLNIPNARAVRDRINRFLELAAEGRWPPGVEGDPP